MLVHIVPRFYACEQSRDLIQLIDVRIDELGLNLRDGIDIVARKPYPNKNYLVACRRSGRRAIDGLLIDCEHHVPAYTVVTRWALSAEMIATHRVNYVVLDEEFDTVSDNMVLWHAWAGRQWASRWPNGYHVGSPAECQPRMQLTPSPDRVGPFKDAVVNDIIVERTEVFHIPTLERDRVTGGRSLDRLPPVDSAFRGSAVPACPRS
jgi:hypothetical protein